METVRMDNEDFFYKLLHSDTEDEVLKVLKNSGYWEETFDQGNSNWELLGQKNNNFSTVNAQASDPNSALVEKIINSMDAMLLSKCFELNIDPRDKHSSPKNMKDAVENFFNVPNGNLANLTSDERRSLSENIQITATGNRGKNSGGGSFTIIDKGEGQTPENMPKTILSIGSQNKGAIRFVQGMFNQGGTAVLQFCGPPGGYNLQLIASKRNPKIIQPNENKNWSFTVIRRYEEDQIKRDVKHSEYAYLAPKGKLLEFNSKEIISIADGKTAYSLPQSHGSLFKLYQYQWTAGNSLLQFDAQRYISRKLLGSPLPVKLVETRYEKPETKDIIMVGVWNRGNDEMEEGFPIEGKINLNKHGIGDIPWKLAVFKEEVKMSKIEAGCFLTVNGQEHGNLGETFITSQLKKEFLDRSLVIDLDITDINRRKREDLVNTSRDKFRENQDFKIIKTFKENETLIERNRIRKEAKQKEKLKNNESKIKIVSEILKQEKNILNYLTGAGIFVTSKMRKIAEEPEYVGNFFPTKFYFTKNKKMKLIHSSPLNKEPRISLDTDVVNDYFIRENSPGKLEFSNPELVKVPSLEFGKLNLVLQFPDDTNPDDEFNLEIKITDDNGSSFTNLLTLVALEEVGRKNSKNTPKTKDRTNNDGDINTPSAGLPEVTQYHHNDEQLDYSVAPEGWGWNDKTSLEIRGDAWYLNMGNRYLETEIKNADKADTELYQTWFEIALLLYGLSIKKALDLEKEFEETDIIVNLALKAISPTIIPVLRSLPNLKL